MRQLAVDQHQGLSTDELVWRYKRYGTNRISSTVTVSALKILGAQFNSPLVVILVLAALLSAWQGELNDTLVVTAVIIINVTIGWLEEYRAERTISKIRQLISPQARVIRAGEESKIPAANLAVGDIIKLEAGDRVPADARVLQSRSLRLNQAALTGESLPVHKRETVVGEKTSLIDRANMLYLGTLVTSGQVEAVVTAVGNQTEVGKIAREVTQVKKRPSDITRKLRVFGQIVALFCLVLSAVTLLVGIYRGIDLVTMSKTTIALLVSLVPEGLPIALTVGLSVGLIRIFRRHAVIRQLQAAETLGSVTTICVDKTGTLTEGEMMVEKILIADDEYDVHGRGFGLSGSFLVKGEKIDPSKTPPLRLGLELLSLSTTSTINYSDLKRDRAQELTDPTETALAVVAAKAGFYPFDELKRHPEIFEAPFDQERRFSCAVHQSDGHYRYIVKGAPETIAHLSAKRLVGPAKTQRLTQAEKADLIDRAELYAKAGYRVVALAYTDRPKVETPSLSRVESLTFVGLLGLSDPIRTEAYKAVESAHQAGIKVIMLTGDHLLTATHIAAKVGLGTGRVIHASELEHHDLDQVSVVSRATPSDKLRIIAQLQKSGQIVAMTGDGINDAPALKKADVGIAMGRKGTDVAIEAADMVLLNNEFGTIIASVEQGRLIWENLRKAIFYLMATSFGEVALLVITLAFGLPLPILAVQILWLNLVTDGLTSMALTVEPAEDDLRHRPPRDPKTPLVDGRMLSRMILVSLLMSLGALLVFDRLQIYGLAVARTGVLTTLVFFQLFNLFNSRSATRSILVMPLLGNRILLLSFGLSVVLQLLAVYYPPLVRLLHTASLNGSQLLLCISVAATVFLLEEGRKFLRKILLAWARVQESFV